MSGSSSRSFTIQRDGIDLKVDVEFSWHGGSSAVTSGPPECCDPGEAPEVEIGTVTLEEDAEGHAAGETITLTAEEEERFLEEVYQDPDALIDDDFGDYYPEED